MEWFPDMKRVVFFLAIGNSPGHRSSTKLRLYVNYGNLNRQGLLLASYLVKEKADGVCLHAVRFYSKESVYAFDRKRENLNLDVQFRINDRDCSLWYYEKLSFRNKVNSFQRFLLFLPTAYWDIPLELIKIPFSNRKDRPLEFRAGFLIMKSRATRTNIQIGM